MLKAAIIGLGDISFVHLNAVRENAGIKLAAVCDIDETRAQLAPGVPFYTDYKEMISQEKPDCVHICLPHFLHYPVAKDAAATGCNIFVEKPAAMNTAETRELIKLEKEYGVRICVCMQNRYNPTSKALLAELRDGGYGRIAGIRGVVAWSRSKEYYTAKPWRGRMAQAGGGCMISQAIHTIDLMQYFAGSPAAYVRGSVSQLLDYGLDIEDTANASILFQSGAKGFFSATVANYEDQSVCIDVKCERASFRIDSGKLFRTDTDEPVLLAEDAPPEHAKKYFGSSHSLLIKQFYEALENKSGEYVEPVETLECIRIIEAIRKSSETCETITLH